MKIRILTFAGATTAAALLAACTAVYKNSDACEQLMRSKLAESSSDTLKIAHTGAGIDGSRVVVEGSIEHVMTASEVAAAVPRVASGARAAVGAGASGVRGALPSSALSASSALAGSSASAATGGSAAASSAAASASSASFGSAPGVSLDGASMASGTSAAGGALGASGAVPSVTSLAASEGQALAVTSAKPKKVVQAAAAECTFHGPALDVFRWLAPAKLAAAPASAASDADE